MASGHQRDISHAISVPSPTRLTSKEAPPPCGVCRRPRCQLHSHRAYLAHRSRSALTKEYTEQPDGTGTGTTAEQDHHQPQLQPQQQRQPRPKLLETSYARSYAYTRTPPSLGAGRLDGFHDLPVSGGHQADLHQSVYNLLHSKIGAATAFPLPAGLAVNEIGGSMIIPVMTDTSLCLSVIAAWKAVQFLMGHIAAFPHLSYETQALQSLRRKLLDQGHAAVTDEAILSAALLWATATMFAQPEALRRHAAGVRALVAARGGLNAIGRVGSIGQAASIRQLILWADFLTAQFLGEDVCFPQHTGPSSSSSSHNNDNDPPMPPSLVKLARALVIPAPFVDVLGEETLKAARDMKLLLISHDAATRTGRLSIAEYKALMSLLNRSTIERISLGHRLRDSHGMDECVVLAMNLLRLTTLFHAGPLVTIVVAAISRLRKALSHTTTLDTFLHGGNDVSTTTTITSTSSTTTTTSSSTEDTNPPPNCIDVYIWACFVGLVNPFDSENRSHFVDMLSTALGLRYRHTGWPAAADYDHDWQRDTLEMLRSFLWSDAVLTPLYAEACRMVEAHILSPAGSSSSSGASGTEGWPNPDSENKNKTKVPGGKR